MSRGLLLRAAQRMQTRNREEMVAVLTRPDSACLEIMQIRAFGAE